MASETAVTAQGGKEITHIRTERQSETDFLQESPAAGMPPTARTSSGRELTKENDGESKEVLAMEIFAHLPRQRSMSFRAKRPGFRFYAAGIV